MRRTFDGARAVSFNDVRNRAANGRELKFSTDDSLIQLYVMPLDEELYTARAAATFLARLRKYPCTEEFNPSSAREFWHVKFKRRVTWWPPIS